MEFTVGREILARELTLLNASLEQKGTIPILSFLLVEPSDSGIRLSATDLDVGLSVDVPAERKGDEAFCVPARELREVVRLSKAESVRVAVDAKERAKLETGGARCGLPTDKKDSFPAIPQRGEAPTISVPARALAAMVASTEFSIADQIGKWAFECARLSVADGLLSATAMDGCRFAYASRPTTKEASMSAMIPRRAFGVLGRFAKESEGEILFSVDENHGFFECGSRSLWTRQSVATFPDEKKMLAQNFSHSLATTVDDLSRCTRGAAIFTDRVPSLRYSFSSKSLSVEGRDSVKGDGTQTVGAEIPSLNGDRIEIGLNGKYVLDFLASSEGAVAVDFTDGKNVVRFRPKEPSELCDSKYYLVPMRLD